MIFRVGDRVRVKNRFVQDSYCAKPGDTGTIRRINDECDVNALGIEWDFSTDYFHTCCNTIENHRGYYIYSYNYEHLEVIPKKIGNIGVFRCEQ